MAILATYGYKQSQVFNINCKIAPLLDLIRRTSHSEIQLLLQIRHEQITKEITEISQKVETQSKRLFYLENPTIEEVVSVPVVKKKSSRDLTRFPKSSHAQAEVKRLEDEKKKAEEEEKKAEEAKRLEEEKKKKKEEAKKVVKKEEVKELSAEEIRTQLIESQKIEIRKMIEEDAKRKIKLQEKLEMIQSSLEKFKTMPKEIDLVDQTGSRKFLKSREDELACRVLNTKSVYGVVVIESDGFGPYGVDGFCVRTIEEDANFVDEDLKKGKGKVPVKKK